MIDDTTIHTFATQIQSALTGLGFAYNTKRGDTVEVSYRKLKRAADRYVLLEVDTNRLPPRVSIPDLETDKVLSHLSAVVGKPVKKLNTVGLTYVIQLQAPKLRPWPKAVDLTDTPEGLAYGWPFGVTRDGAAIWGDLLKTGHILIGGKPGAGKSTAINAGLIALLRSHSPESLRLLLVDPKAVELWPYAGLPHLARPVATQADEAAEAVTWLVEELARREAIFKSAGAKSLTDFNRLGNGSGSNGRGAFPKLPLLLAVFDEVTDLVIQWGGAKAQPFLDLTRVSSKGRAFGIVLLLATQNPKADILDTALRENAGTRVSFKVDQANQSRSILGQAGGEAIPAGKPGRLVMVGPMVDGPVTLQGFKVDDAEVARLVGSLKTEAPSPFNLAEAALIVFARDHLGGAFKLTELYREFKGVWSWRQLQKIGRAWEGRGWLTHPADATSPRLMTEELLQLAQGVGPEAVEAVKRSKGSDAEKPEELRSSAPQPVEEDPTPLTSL